MDHIPGEADAVRLAAERSRNTCQYRRREDLDDCLPVASRFAQASWQKIRPGLMVLVPYLADALVCIGENA